MIDRDPRNTTRRGLRIAGLCLLLVLVATIVAAQPATEVAAAAPTVNVQTGEVPSVWQLFMTSRIINGLIALLSVISLLLFLYFITTISAAAMAPTVFVDDVNKLVRDQKFEQVADLCRANPEVFIATIVQRCAENADKEHAVIMNMIDSEGRRSADLIWNRISYLADVSNVAPMLGLLGTVIGMINAFFSLRHGSDSINSGLLSDGVAQAMATTMFGLIVAITSLLFYTLVKSRLTRALAGAEHVVHSISDHIKRGGQ
jgi:biopolymer transport protein ExbB